MIDSLERISSTKLGVSLERTEQRSQGPGKATLWQVATGWRLDCLLSLTTSWSLWWCLRDLLLQLPPYCHLLTSPHILFLDCPLFCLVFALSLITLTGMPEVFTLWRAARLLFEVCTSVQRLIKPSQFTGSVKGLNTCSAPCPAPRGVSQPPSISTCIYQQPRKSKRSPRVSRRWHPNAQHHLQLPDILFSLAVLSFIRLLWLSAGGHRACTWLTSGSVFRPRQHRAVWSNVNHFSNIITSSSQKIQTNLVIIVSTN